MRFVCRGEVTQLSPKCLGHWTEVDNPDSNDYFSLTLKDAKETLRLLVRDIQAGKDISPSQWFRAESALCVLEYAGKEGSAEWWRKKIRKVLKEREKRG